MTVSPQPAGAPADQETAAMRAFSSGRRWTRRLAADHSGSFRAAEDGRAAAEPPP